jgi:hypothetical protein
MAHLLCRVEEVSHTGTLQWIPIQKVDGKKITPITDNVVALNKFIDPKRDKKNLPNIMDMRSGGPFLQLIPCPYCGTEKDSQHDPIKHINHSLGISEEKIIKLAKTMPLKDGKLNTSKAALTLLYQKNQ